MVVSAKGGAGSAPAAATISGAVGKRLEEDRSVSVAGTSPWKGFTLTDGKRIRWDLPHTIALWDSLRESVASKVVRVGYRLGYCWFFVYLDYTVLEYTGRRPPKVPSILGYPMTDCRDHSVFVYYGLPRVSTKNLRYLREYPKKT